MLLLKPTDGGGEVGERRGVRSKSNGEKKKPNWKGAACATTGRDWRRLSRLTDNVNPSKKRYSVGQHCSGVRKRKTDMRKNSLSSDQ